MRDKIKGARDEAERVLPDLKAGRDPKVVARVERAAQRTIAANQITLADAVPLYVEYFRHHKPGKDGKLGRRSWESEAYKLRVVCQNWGWGDRLIDEVTDNEAAVLLDAMRASGLGASINRVHSTMIQFFKWARDPGRDFARPAINPFIELERRAEERERDRTLSPEEIAFLWSILTSTEYTPNAHRSLATRRILMCLLLTAQRLSQFIGLRRDECQIAPDGVPVFVWSAERMKAAKEFVLPMSPTVHQIIEQAKRETNGDLLFPSLDGRNFGGELWAPSIWTYANNLVKKHPEHLAPFAVHDLRATGATMLYDTERFEPYDIAKILSHAQHHDKRIPKSTPRYIRTKNQRDRWRGLDAKIALVNALEDVVLNAALPGRVTRLRAA